MRYPKEHKAEARRQLLDKSARHAKLHGFAASGVDALASAAGVTIGSLYKHFDGKSELFAELIRTELKHTADRFADIAPGDVEAAGKAVAAYLSPQHMRHPELGCPLPTLTAEVARADVAVRDAFEEGLLALHAQLEHLTDSSAKAWALIAQCVGGVMLARSVASSKLHQVVLESAASQAQLLLGDAKRSRPRKRTKP